MKLKNRDETKPNKAKDEHMIKKLFSISALASFTTLAMGSSPNNINPPTTSKPSQVASKNINITNISYITGSTYELGDDHRKTLRFDNANTWAYGDNFFFFEVTSPFKKGTSIYGEWQPRLSLSKITGKGIGFGPLSDLLLAGEINYSGTGSRAYLYGLGTNIKIPGFTFFKFNVYNRKDPSQPGSTYQISWSWLARFQLFFSRLKFEFGGFCDYAGQQHNLEHNFLAKPQLLIDAGNLIAQKPNHIFAGIRYVYWKNKLGVKGVTESVPEFMVTWRIT